MFNCVVVFGRQPHPVRRVRPVAYWGVTLLGSAVIALPAAAWMATFVFGPSKAPAITPSGYEKALEKMGRVMTANLPQCGIAHFDRYIESIRVLPPLYPLSKSFEESPTPIPDDLRKLMNKQDARLLVEIRLSPEGYDSVAVKNGMLNYVGSLLLLHAQEGDQYTQFVWIYFVVRHRFGPLIFVKAQRLVMVVDVKSLEQKDFSIEFWEPDDTRVLGLDFEWPPQSPLVRGGPMSGS